MKILNMNMLWKYKHSIDINCAYDMEYQMYEAIQIVNYYNLEVRWKI
jgi:hypothetical protein